MNAEFAINIAAEMAGGGQTLAELDSLTASMLTGGKNADFLIDAMTRVSAELATAKTEAAAANAALSESNAEFARLERASAQAAVALEKAERSGKFTDMQLMMLADHAGAASSELAAHKTVLAGVENAAKAAGVREKALGDQLGNLRTLNGHVNKTLGEQAEGLEKIRGALGAAGGPLGKFAAGVLAPIDGFHKLSGAMGESKAMAVVLSSVVAALTVAVLASGVAALAWGVSLANSNRNTALATQAAEAMHPELAALRDTFAAVSRETGMHSDELQELSGRLKEAGVSARDMPDALRAAALAETALGKGGAGDFVADIKAGTASVSELAAETQNKLGGIVARQMLGLGAQGERLKKNFGDIFGSLNIEPVLTGLSRLVGLFDASSAAGQTLQFFFGKIFGPVVEGADGAAIAIEAFALGAMIWAVKGYLAFRPYTEVFKAIGVGIGVAGLVFLSTFVPGALAATAAMLPLVGAAVVAAAPFLGIAAAAAAVYLAFTNWGAITDFVKGVFDGLPPMAQAVIQGLIDGFLGAGPAVLSALGGVVSGAITGAKALLGIHSPSKVFAEIGDNTLAGFTGAVDAGAEDVTASVSGAISPSIEAAAADAGPGNIAAMTAAAAPAAPSPAGPDAPAAAPGGDVTYNFYARTVDDAKALAETFLEIVRGGALAGGSNPEPG